MTKKFIALIALVALTQAGVIHGLCGEWAGMSTVICMQKGGKSKEQCEREEREETEACYKQEAARFAGMTTVKSKGQGSLQQGILG